MSIRRWVYQVRAKENKYHTTIIEDIGEYLYNIDRMLYQLKSAGKFQKPAAVLVGSFTDLKDTERPFGREAYEIIRDILEDFDYPVCFGFPVGHVKENFALKCGAEHRLKIGKERVLLEEVWGGGPKRKP